MPWDLAGRPYDRYLAAAYGVGTIVIDDNKQPVTVAPGQEVTIAWLRANKYKLTNAPRDATNHLSIPDLEKHYRDKFGSTKVKKWPPKKPVIAAIRDLARASHVGFSCVLRFALYTGPTENQDQADIVTLCRQAIEEHKHFFIKPDPRACGNCNNRVANVGDFIAKKKGNGYQLCHDCKGSLDHITKRRQQAEAELAAKHAEAK